MKRIRPSESDRKNLSRLRTETPKEDDRYDFDSIVVNKPWGYEYLMYKNRRVAVWILHIKHGHATSLHCHPNKKTSLLSLWGKVTCQTLEGWTDRAPFEGLIIENGVFHSTRANSPGGAFVMEVETPPVKRDLVRLRDEYGRAKKPYEGRTKMSRNLGKYSYVSFMSNDKKQTDVKRLKDSTFSIRTRDEILKDNKHVRSQKNSLVCLLRGRIETPDRTLQLDVGEIVRYDVLTSLDREAEDSLFLLIQKSISHA